MLSKIVTQVVQACQPGSSIGRFCIKFVNCETVAAGNFEHAFDWSRQFTGGRKELESEEVEIPRVQ